MSNTGESTKALWSRLSTCPCCGYRSMYESCQVCGWEECASDEMHPDLIGLPNRFSLREAQEYFRLFGYFQPTTEPGDTKKFERDPDWKALPPLFRGPVADPDIGNDLKTCLCCGYLSIRVSMNSCPICGWVYSAQQEDPDLANWPNNGSLRMCQANFAEFGARSQAYKKLVRAPNEADKKDPNWRRMDCSQELAKHPDSKVGIPVIRIPYKPRYSVDESVRSEISCPVCGYYARTRAVGRCPICLWDLYLGHRDEVDESRPNPVTLRKAQANFEAFGAYREFPLELSRFRRPRAPTKQDRRNPNWRLPSL